MSYPKHARRKYLQLVSSVIHMQGIANTPERISG
jgi:hypothetical protein